LSACPAVDAHRADSDRAAGGVQQLPLDPREEGHLCFGNITGAMVFQSCIPVTIGIPATSWTINLNDPVQVLQAASIHRPAVRVGHLPGEQTARDQHRRALLRGDAVCGLHSDGVHDHLSACYIVAKADGTTWL
jgi:hypothetical protein